MTRRTFLTIAAAIAVAVGLVALAGPTLLLASKGVGPNAAARVWVREVGVLLIALGVTAYRLRDHADSPTMRAFLFGNALIQLGLLPIELLARAEGVLTLTSGVVPNTLAHIGLAVGFLWFSRSAPRTGLRGPTGDDVRCAA